MKGRGMVMNDISQLLLYIPGIVIFMVGSGQVRDWLRKARGNVVNATVIGCKHVVKKDSKDREIYNYYDVQIDVKNPKTGCREHRMLKSPSEYAKGQEVSVSFTHGKYANGKNANDKNNGTDVSFVREDNSRLSPWVMMMVGALLIVLVLEENQGREIQAMVCLAIILLGLGINLVADFVSMKKRGLVRLKGEIIDVHKRQISKETKILKGSKYTYYPIVKYVLDGATNIRHCNVNSSGANTFKRGDTLALYIDTNTSQVLERNAGIAEPIVGTILTVLGILVAASLISVMI
jgi:hypothetical protein